MRSETVTCDVCGATKGEGNKWIMGWATEHGFALGDWVNGFEYRMSGPVSHFCSEACALKEQARYLRRVA